MKQPVNPLIYGVGTHRDLSALVGSVKQALLSPASSCAYIGISRTGLHRLSENDPTFPRKIVMSKRCVGYRSAAQDAWLAAKESAV